DVVDFDADAVGVLEQGGIVARRPMALLRRAHDLRPETARHLVDGDYVFAGERAEAYVMQPRTGLVEVQAAILPGGAPHRESSARPDTVEVVVGVVNDVLEAHEGEQAAVKGDA